MKKIFRKQYIWIIFLLLVSMGSLSAELINKRFEMADLEVYYKAASRLIDGGELYRAAEEDPYEHYVYKYSPPAALLFVPLTIVPLETAKYIYWIFLTFILGHSLIMLNKSVGKDPQDKSRNGINILLILIIGTHFFRELHLGQVNLLLLWLYVIALHAYIRNKGIAMAIPLAISVFIKPFALIFLPFLFLTKKFKASGALLSFMLLFSLLPLLFYQNFNSFFGLYTSWVNEMAIELGTKQELLAEGNHTMFSVLARYSPLRLLSLTGTAKMIYQLVVILAYGSILLWYILKFRSSDGRVRIFVVLIATIPLLAFTSYNAFIFTLPMLAYLLLHYKDLKMVSRVLLIVGCILIGGNIYDLVGPSLFDFFWGISVYSWGTMGLIAIIMSNEKRRTSRSAKFLS